jgi:hypothetical protein
LIYRVVGESSKWVWSEESGAMEISLSPGRLMGAFNAGVADEAWGDLPMPMLSNPGCVSGSPNADGVPMACAWRPKLEPVAAPSVSSGARIRAKSMVIYRDDWQVALLPDRD